MPKVKVWFQMADAVNIANFEGLNMETQIKPSGVGLVIVKNEAGKLLQSTSFGKCWRIDFEAEG